MLAINRTAPQIDENARRFIEFKLVSGLRSKRLPNAERNDHLTFARNGRRHAMEVRFESKDIKISSQGTPPILSSSPPTQTSPLTPAPRLT